jgi:hypothetical protein
MLREELGGCPALVSNAIPHLAYLRVGCPVVVRRQACELDEASDNVIVLLKRPPP